MRSEEKRHRTALAADRLDMRIRAREVTAQLSDLSRRIHHGPQRQ